LNNNQTLKETIVSKNKIETRTLSEEDKKKFIKDDELLNNEQKNKLKKEKEKQEIIDRRISEVEQRGQQAIAELSMTLMMNK
jgi:hypothetical protein